jgi:hypothetical protein
MRNPATIVLAVLFSASLAVADKNDGVEKQAAPAKPLKFEDIQGRWCSKRFEIKLTRKAFFSKNLKHADGKSYAISKYSFYAGYFRMIYWGNNYIRQFAYEFHIVAGDRELHLKRILTSGGWRRVDSVYSRKCA